MAGVRQRQHQAAAVRVSATGSGHAGNVLFPAAFRLRANTLSGSLGACCDVSRNHHMIMSICLSRRALRAAACLYEAENGNVLLRWAMEMVPPNATVHRRGRSILEDVGGRVVLYPKEGRIRHCRVQELHVLANGSHRDLEA